MSSTQTLLELASSIQVKDIITFSINAEVHHILPSISVPILSLSNSAFPKYNNFRAH